MTRRSRILLNATLHILGWIVIQTLIWVFPYPTYHRGSLFGVEIVLTPHLSETIFLSTLIVLLLSGFGLLFELVLGLPRQIRPPRPFGLCPTCGYDLRATPDRCPECGTVPRRSAS